MYRTEEPTRTEPTGKALDKSTGTVIRIMNGINSRIAFPCYYAYRRDGMPFPYHALSPMMKDHLGWPSPDSRDRSYQPQLVENLVMTPIDLDEEGYTTATVVMSDPPTGLTATATIDDNVVRLNLTAMCDDADEEEVEVPFSIYVSGTLTVGSESYTARDMLTHGTIKILPAIHDNE